MRILTLIACFILVFLIGCTIAMIVVVLSAEDADGKYYEIDELEILDILTEGDEED